MIEVYAIVSRACGRRIEIEVQRDSACSHCERNGGCGIGAVSRLLGYRAKPLVIESHLDLKVGDSLLLGLPESRLLKASLLVYGLPLLALLGGAIYGQVLFGDSEGAILISASTGFLGGLFVTARLAKRSVAVRFCPRILQVNGELEENQGVLIQ